MLASAPKRLSQTICISSSSDTDIIECSTDDVYETNNFFKTPRSHFKRKCKNSPINNVILLKGFQFQNENQTKTPDKYKPCSSLRSKTESSVLKNDSVIFENNIKSSTLEGQKCKKNNDHYTVNRVLSTIHKTPDLPYLSKSKLARIEKWLMENDVETVKTPPFTNLNGTPVSIKRSSTKSSLTRSSYKKKQLSDSCSIDSEVEKVLVAVYGEDWRNKNVLSKSKTEPKRHKKILISKTDVKVNTRSEIEYNRRVRRNILKSVSSKKILFDEDKYDNLDSSLSLGVEKLNESGFSNDSVLGNNFSCGKTIREASSDSGALKSQSVKKKKEEKKLDKQVCDNTEQMKISTRKKESEKNSVSKKTPMKTFLDSLSVSTPKRRCHPEAQDYKINYKTKKEELTKRLFKLYNSEVFENGLPEDMVFSWNVKMRRTAGYCYNKKILKSTGQVIRLSRIELSAKIVDRADRLRDTLIHELCHAASWVIDGMLDGHGAVWTKWSRKAMERFPELPVIKRCHNYEIASKYTYKCAGCGYSINRCSKSIDVKRKRCGYCFGLLELFVNKRRKGKGEIPEFDSTRTIAAPNNFALFVKENYHNVKSTRKDAKHAEIMKILGQQYALSKKLAETSSTKK